MDPLLSASRIAQSGLTAQSERLRVVAENLANANSTGRVAGADPYTRKTVTFRTEFDELVDQDVVKVSEVGRDRSPYRIEHEPGHPAADADGFVKYPNVEPVLELADMREANRAYLANLQVIKSAREAVSAMLDLLKGPG
ncbi:MAG: flagellar basal body rod protein FlgC [Hyphomicrobium sp.]|nr:flagellar basal body rod protein FlgC [Hyphomicrobium sp.]